MSSEIYKPSKDIVKNAHVDADKYAAMYHGSLEQPDIFWAVQAKRLSWFKQPTIIKNTSFEGNVDIKWWQTECLL